MTLTTQHHHRRGGNYLCGAAKDNRNMHEVRRQRRMCEVIGRAVAKWHGFTLTQLRSVDKPAPLARARLWAMAIACELSGASEPETARMFGRTHHNSVRHAKKVAARACRQTPFRNTKQCAIAAVRAEIRAEQARYKRAHPLQEVKS